MLDSSSQLVTYAVVQYLFDKGIEVPIVLPPHGNAKHQVVPYHRTQKSTIEKLKQTGGKPKWVVASVHDDAVLVNFLVTGGKFIMCDNLVVIKPVRVAAMQDLTPFLM